MNYEQAKAQFGPMITVPKPDEGGLLLSGDGVFFTLQGEGPSVGMPAVFIRTHLCNLACDWSGRGGQLCDAWYTWKRDTKEYWTEHKFVTFDQLWEEVSKYSCKRLVFTGGEPLMQQKQILEFCRRCQLFTTLGLHPQESNEWIFEIETNGTIHPLSEFLGTTRYQINCSPKLTSSGNKWQDAIKGDVLTRLNESPNTTFKFVALDERDLAEIHKIVNMFQLDSKKIMVMPEGTSPEAITEHMQRVAEYVKKVGWRMTPRLQIYVWGNKRAT